MTELPVDKHIQAARREVRVRAWEPPRTEAAWRELGLRRLSDRERRRTRTRVGALALAAAMFALVVVALWTVRPSAPTAPSARASASMLERLALGDATEVRFLEGTRLDVREQTEARVVVSVQRGTAHFSVRHDPRRLFRVEAGDVEVEDLGTQFEVENTGTSVRVSVSEGSVAVSFLDEPGGKRRRATLKVGESGVYPSDPARTQGAGVASSSVSVAPSAAASVQAPGGSTSAGPTEHRLARARPCRQTSSGLRAHGSRRFPRRA